MMQFPLGYFLDGRAQEFGKLVGGSYERFNSNPSARYLTDAFVYSPASGAVTWVLEPGKKAGYTNLGTAPTDRAFIGDAFLSLAFTNTMPSTYTISVGMRVVEPLSFGIDPDLILARYNDVNNPIMLDQLVTVKIPVVPFVVLYVDFTGGNFTGSAYVTFHGLQIVQ